MHELIDRRLRDQEQSLRAVMASFEQVSRLTTGLGRDIGWIGPASDAYEAAVAALRGEMQVAEAQLGAALRETVSAMGAGVGATGESCGG